MNNFRKIVIGLIALICVSCSGPSENGSLGVTQPVDLVNPYMGNISHLLVPTFPTVHLPNSMMRMTPDRGTIQKYPSMVFRCCSPRIGVVGLSV